MWPIRAITADLLNVWGRYRVADIDMWPMARYGPCLWPIWSSVWPILLWPIWFVADIDIILGLQLIGACHYKPTTATSWFETVFFKLNETLNVTHLCQLKNNRNMKITRRNVALYSPSQTSHPVFPSHYHALYVCRLFICLDVLESSPRSIRGVSRQQVPPS